MRGGALHLAAAAAVAAAALFALRAGPRAPVAPVAPVPPHESNSPSAVGPSAAAAAAARTEELPPELRGTRVDGDLPLDSRGDLVVGPGVRRFFDYFLVASGDLAPESLRALVAAEIRRRVPAKAAARALDLFDRYLEYRRRAAALDDPDSDPEARFAALVALRREVIGTRDAAALFGEEEESLRAALERRRIAQDPRLSPEEKERALADAEARLPEAEREARADAVSAVQLWNDERALRARGASPEEIRQLREARVGREAADRLEALDRERAEFQASLEQARGEQAALAEDPDLSPEQRAQALEQWIEAHVPELERAHARAVLGVP